MIRTSIGLFFILVSLPTWAQVSACLDFYTLTPKIFRVAGPNLKKNTLSGVNAKEINQILDRTHDFDRKIQNLLNPFRRFEMEEMFFRYHDAEGNVVYFPMYRNSDLLADTTFEVGGRLSKAGKYLTNVEFGYQNVQNQKVQMLGVIDAIELDSNGHPKKFIFQNHDFKYTFKNHFFGRPFTPTMRRTILDINTAIFKYLSTHPVAQAKVSEFEVKRGWPAGTARKLGLVYFSKEVLDLKDFAFQNKFSYEEMAAAGWLKPFVTRRNTIGYRENYDNSIKIPFYDEANPNQVAFWRTRNLDTSGGRPKYLSWPKDRSLYEDAPLFEEFYNSWNLSKAKGNKIVLTEGEFKCAIGEMMTGIFHLGVPGIGQFHDSMLASLVKAAPSEVVVLFDRDPVGKGLMRVDEVTDSQRASFLIAKRLEAAGIPVKVATLPDIYQGKKIGIDDLLLSHGPAPYLKALDQAVLPSMYAQQIHIDETLTFLTDRRGKIKNALHRYQNANLAAGVIGLHQMTAFKDLTLYSEMIESAFRFYMKTVYPDRKSLSEPSHRFTMIPADGRWVIKTAEGLFELTAPILEITVTAADVKNCTRASCFAINKQSQQLARMTEYERKQALELAIGEIFPTDDYSYIENPSMGSKYFAVLVIRKDSRTPVAIIEQF